MKKAKTAKQEIVDLKAKVAELESRLAILEATERSRLPWWPSIPQPFPDYVPPYIPPPTFPFPYETRPVCPTCGLVVDGPIGYVCSIPNCPMGLAGPYCGTGGDAVMTSGVGTGPGDSIMPQIPIVLISPINIAGVQHEPGAKMAATVYSDGKAQVCFGHGAYVQLQPHEFQIST